MIPDDDARDEMPGDAREDAADETSNEAVGETTGDAQGPAQAAPEPLDVRMRGYAEAAVSYAHGSHNFRLDFSDRSIASVDAIADRIQQYIPRNRISKWLRPGPTDDEIDHLCHLLGGYIGETYVRLKGGEWAIKEDTGAIGIVRNGGWVFPIEKVRKRMRGSQDENLYRYFKVVLDEA
ncbi:MAG: hypothetical protein KA144_08865 [Xanthomonadaceae bacterium]|nr:hypothetical protein [Xanthomonadaceae bacterium]